MDKMRRFNLNNLLSGGIHFEEVEADLAFRVRFLNGLILIAITAALLFVAMDLFGVNMLGDLQLRFTELYALIAFLVGVSLRGRKQAYTAAALVILIASFLVFSSALMLVLSDEFRIIWYYILVFAAYVLLGNRAGMVATLAPIMMVSAAKFSLGIEISDNAFSTFIISLLVISGIALSYTRLSNSYFERMTANVNKLRELATKDPLTGLWNARAFYDMSNKLISLGQRNTKPHCTLFIDLDHFKSINDRFGHATGDKVLRAVAECIASSCRDSDIVGRVGGEEFVVFLPNTDATGAMLLAEKIRKSVETLMHKHADSDPYRVTLSIGVAHGASADRSVEDIQRRADAAMYNAKKQGRNRVVLAAG
jgi:diguanylate cyclase (GGDEF)-like protein